MEALSNAIAWVSNALWSYLLIYTLIPVGLYFTIKLGFAQFLHIKHMLKLITEGVVSTDKDGKSISSFGAASSMIENTLAQAYKLKNGDGTYRGGPAYYMQQGLGSKAMGVAFSILITISFGLIFNSVQANTIVQAFGGAFKINPLLLSLALATVTGIIIFGGLKRIVSFTQVIFPAMAGVYLLVAFIVVGAHITEMPSVFKHIFAQAFGFEQVASGGFAFMVMQGIKRGLFSNEAGMGSTPNAGATAEVSHPVKQGYIQTLGVFVDTLIISTATAFVILASNVHVKGSDINGIQLTQLAVSSIFGNWGDVFIAFIVLLFSFSLIIGNYYYGESNIEYMSNSKLMLNIFRVLVIFMVVVGGLAKLQNIWNLADIFMGLMALMNIVALVALRDVAFKLYKDYRKQLKEGKDPVFHKHTIPELESVECWDDDHKKFYIKNAL